MKVIQQNMWSCDVARILKVPIGTPGSRDGNYWFFSKHGKFTVRSCYHFIMGQALNAEPSISGSSNSLSSKEWKWIWGLQLPPMIRIFLWRACNEILLVKVSLVNRKIGGNPFCPFCRVRLETTAHIFFECASMVWVWNAEPFAVQLLKTMQILPSGCVCFGAD